MRKATESRWPQRVIFGLLALLVVIIGLGRVLRDGANFVNWWHEIVFAPFFIAIGVVALLAAIRPSSFKEKKKSRIRGWPTGKSQ
jgi:uncharacterized membrane protein